MRLKASEDYFLIPKELYAQQLWNSGRMDDWNFVSVLFSFIYL